MTAYAESRGFDPAGLIIGDENGDLMLDRTLTNAQLAQILLRLRAKPVPVFTEVSDLQILATSDLHGKFYPWLYATDSEDLSGSMTQLATAVKALRTDNSLLVDAGDTVQDNYAQFFLGEDVHPMIAAMNAIGYDVWVTGNHEYNYSLANLKNVIGTLDAKVLVGNVLDADGQPLADGWTVIEKNGLRIGVIGMVTPNITRWDEINLAGCTVADPVEETRRIIDEIKDETDLLIGVMHMGVNNEYGVPDTGVTDLAEACPELALIVAALFLPDANLKEGDIRRCDASEIYKFDNTLYKLRMTGAQLKTYMEWAAGYYNQFQAGDLTISFNPAFRANVYDMFADVNYEIDISKPVGERIVKLTRTAAPPT